MSFSGQPSKVTARFLSI